MKKIFYTNYKEFEKLGRSSWFFQYQMDNDKDVKVQETGELVSKEHIFLFGDETEFNTSVFIDENGNDCSDGAIGLSIYTNEEDKEYPQYCIFEELK